MLPVRDTEQPLVLEYFSSLHHIDKQSLFLTFIKQNLYHEGLV